MAKPPTPHASWLPADYDLADATAVRACASGTASADQQRRAMRWIVEQAADLYGPSYREESARDSDHHEGRRHVGQQVVKLINMPADLLAKMRRKSDVGNSSHPDPGGFDSAG